MLLSDNFGLLRIEERNRLEKKLGIILRKSKSSHLLRKSLHHIFGRLEKKTQESIFERLLASFGGLSAAHLSAEEQTQLRSHPMTLWPEPDFVTIPIEAMEAMSKMESLRKKHFLFAEIFRLSSAEKKAWSRWLNLDALPSATELYNQIGRTRQFDLLDEGSKTLYDGRSLDEFFPMEEMSPLLWFYKGIVPLYEGLRMTAAQAEKTGSSFNSELLRLLKLGYLIVSPLPVEFGQMQRYVLRATPEKNAGLRNEVLPSYKEDALERGLF